MGSGGPKNGLVYILWLGILKISARPETGYFTGQFEAYYYPYFRDEETEALVSVLKSHKAKVWIQTGPIFKILFIHF